MCNEKKTGENEWLIKHSCVKLNHCSENSILHKKSRFNGIYEIELWREKNTRRDLSWAYNFLVSWRYRLREKSQNYLTFISSKIVQLLVLAISGGSTIVTKPARGSGILCLHFESLVLIASRAAHTTNWIIVGAQFMAYNCQYVDYVRHRKLPTDDSMKNSRTVRPPTQYTHCWPAFIAYSADVNSNWWRCSYNFFLVLSIRRLP